jgi:hypothetical protein
MEDDDMKAALQVHRSADCSTSSSIFTASYRAGQNYCGSIRVLFSVSFWKCRVILLESSWNVMAHGDAREGKWRGNWRMEWVASTLYTTLEHGVSSITTITTADAHTSAASCRPNWRLRIFKWTRPFRRKEKSGFCACAITFQTQPTTIILRSASFDFNKNKATAEIFNLRR